MSYNPTTWADGDTVTPALLNKMEQGAGGGSPAIFVDSTYLPGSYCAQLNKTWGELYDALNSGVIVYVKIPIGAAFGEDPDDGYCISVLRKLIYRPEIVDPNIFGNCKYYFGIMIMVDPFSIHQEAVYGNSANEYPQINLNFG